MTLNRSQKGSILLIACSAYLLGGLATWLDYVIPGLLNKGWNVVLGLTSGKLHNVDAYLKVHPFKNVIRIENKTGSREGRIRSIMNAIKDTKPDIVGVVNIADAYVAVERLREKNSAGTRVVMTLHGIQADLYEDAQNFRDGIDAVICTNKLACRLTQDDAGFEAGRIYYAPCGVELPKQYQRSMQSRPLLIAYAGRLDHFQKRVNDIPKILSILKGKGIPFECVIAGGGPAEKDLLDKIKDLKLDDKVNFLGVLSYEDLVRQVYKEAVILLITSFWETGPIVAWEAMAHGLAVVTSRYVGSGLENSLKDGENCLTFPVGDAQGSADCIASLNDSALRATIVAAGYQLVQSRYSRMQSVGCWDSVFEQILSKPPLKSERRSGLVPSAGRLDAVFGPRIAETIRYAAGRRFIHNDPGGEWPHSYGTRRENDSLFWEKAGHLDEG